MVPMSIAVISMDKHASSTQFVKVTLKLLNFFIAVVLSMISWTSNFRDQSTMQFSTKSTTLSSGLLRKAST